MAFYHSVMNFGNTYQFFHLFLILYRFKHCDRLNRKHLNQRNYKTKKLQISIPLVFAWFDQNYISLILQNYSFNITNFSSKQNSQKMEIHCQRDNDLLENVTSSLSRPMSSRKTMKRLKSGKMPSTKDPFDLPAHRPTDPQTATTYCGAQSCNWDDCFLHLQSPQFINQILNSSMYHLYESWFESLAVLPKAYAKDLWSESKLTARN